MQFRSQEIGMFRPQVAEFNVSAEYLTKYKPQNAGGDIHNELWIPAEELEEFNKNIIGKIEVTKKFESKA